MFYFVSEQDIGKKNDMAMICCSIFLLVAWHTCNYPVLSKVS